MTYMGEGDKYKIYIPHDLVVDSKNKVPDKIQMAFSPVIYTLEIHKVKSTGGKPVQKARHLFENALANKDREL